MSVVGVDIGESKTCIAACRNRGVDILTNEVSNRFTPTLIGFGGDQRLLGEAAKTQEVMNFKNTVTSLKRLIGRKFDEADVQNSEKKFALFNLVAAENGETGAEVSYAGETKVFSMTQMMAMFLTQIKKTAENNLKTGVSDIVLSVPAYYTDQQRHAIQNAAEIAGLNTLRLINEPAAAALAYGITRVSELPETEPRHVVFVDVGHSAMTVTVAAFTKEKAVIKATAFDRHLGGRQFDEDLTQHFAKEIQAKHKIDINSKPKALLRLRVAVEKLKKMLSANSKAVLNVESLTDEIDVHSTLTREEFEELIKLSLERVESPLRVALHSAGIRKDQVEFVELIGGSTRVPAIRKIVGDFFGNKEGLISTTLNLDEAVARGAALQCAMISPLFKVRDYNLKDATVYDLKATWTSESGEANESVVFKEADGIPSAKSLTFFRTTDFEVQAQYATPQQLAAGSSLEVGKYLIKGIKPSVAGKPVEVKLKVRLNGNGQFAVESAQQVEEIEEVAAAPAAAAAAPAEEDKMDATPAAAESTPKEEQPATPAAAAEEKKDEEKKRKVKKADLKVEVVANASLAAKTIASLRELETSMMASDKLIADTQEKRNNLEEYIYDMRSKLAGEHGKFMEDSVKDKFTAQLQETEDWLYADGETATKGVFVERLDALKKTGQPMVEKYIDAETRPKAIADLKTALNQFQQIAQSWEEKYEHLDQADRAKVTEKCAEKSKWLDDLIAQQDKLKPWDAPVLKTSAVNAEKELLAVVLNPIVNKPKPKKAAEEPPKPAETPKKEETPSPAPDAPKQDDQPNMDVD